MPAERSAASLDEALRMLAATPVLLVALDFDGTLAPIVPRPEDATPTPRARRALNALARQPHTRVAIVSGRALADLEARLGAVEPEVLLVGGHGSEFEPERAGRLSPPLQALRARVRAVVDAAADGLEGVEAEHKDASSALHYRRAARADAAEALARLGRARGELAIPLEDGLGLLDPEDEAFVERRADGALLPHLRRGKRVVELSVLRTHKGHALDRLRRELGATRVLFLGDDRTDEDAFRSLGAADLGVKVGPGATRATQRVADPAEAAELLVRLVSARRAALAASVTAPIDRLSFLSDGKTGALVAPSGEIPWLCPGRFDHPAVFASLLGGPTAGRFVLRPAEDASEGFPRYLDGGLVLETRWPGLRLRDWLDPHARGCTVLVRELVPEGPGPVRVALELAPRPDFARMDARIEREGDVLRVRAGATPFELVCPDAAGLEIRREGASDTARGLLEIREPTRLVLRCGFCEDRAVSGPEETLAFWAEAAELPHLPRAYRDEVRLAARVLRGLVHRPSGALAAAATTSLPEVLGGERNWDYRYCWPRDAAYACDALVRLGSLGEAAAFLDWTRRVIEAGSALDLHPVYGVGGELLHVEGELGHLMGYAASQPVRIGNAASEQLQVDVYGAILDLAWTFARHGGEIDEPLWTALRRLVRGVEVRWREPDAGIWEHRHRIRHHVHSKVMAWASVDRALRLARLLDRAPGPGWADLRDAIAAEVLERGWSEEAGAFSVAYGSPDLDAASLSVLLSGLLSPDDPRAVATVDAIQAGLRAGPTVYRYRFDDGLAGDEGGFHICTAWLVDALHRTGRPDEARALFEAMLGCAGPTGLLSEMVDPATGTALGNTPQAYSHTGVIWCALTLSGSPRAPGAG